MTRRRTDRWRWIAAAATACLLASCASPAPSPAPSGSAPSASGTPKPAGGFAVVTTRPDDAGPYTVAIVDLTGHLVAQTTAKTPSTYAYGSGLPTTSISGSRVYYRNGDSEVDWLAADGSHGSGFSVTHGRTDAVAFAVSPDDARVAIATITNFPTNENDGPSVSTMYVQDLDGRNRTTVFRGTAATNGTPLTWPVGWHGEKVVVGQVLDGHFNGMFGRGTNECPIYGWDCASQVRTFDPDMKVFGPPLCGTQDEVLSGAPTAAGAACELQDVVFGLSAYSWAGHRRVFSTHLDTENRENGSRLSPDGSRIHCDCALLPEANHGTPLPGGTGNTQTFIHPDGTQEQVSDPHASAVLGWIDNDHLFVVFGVTPAFGILNLATSDVTPLTRPPAGELGFEGPLPGGL